MEKKKPIPEKGIFWAYYAPDGNIQMRSIGQTRKLSREFISYREYDDHKKVTWKDYEKKGFVLKQINLKITPILAPSRLKNKKRMTTHTPDKSKNA